MALLLVRCKLSTGTAHTSAKSLRALTLLVQLQQKALEVDSGRVSAAIQNLINSWKASDSESDQATETSSSGRQVPQGRDAAFTNPAGPSSQDDILDESPNPDPSGKDEQQQEKRNRLLSLFYRGRNGQQQQPEELMPLQVVSNSRAFALMVAHCTLSGHCDYIPIYNMPFNGLNALFSRKVWVICIAGACSTPEPGPTSNNIAYILYGVCGFYSSYSAA